MKRLLAGAGLGLLLSHSVVADTVEWTFEGTDFINENGTLSGGFSLDPDTGIVSDVSISTTAGDFILCLPDCAFAETFTGASYDQAFPAFTFGEGNTGIQFFSNAADTAVLLLADASLTGVGGSVGLVQIREWRCESAPANCERDIAVTPFRSVFDGAVEALDADHDGINFDQDNCLLQANSLQTDSDADNIGNVCDADIAVPNNCLVNFPDLLVMQMAFFSSPASPDWNPDADLTGSNGQPDNVVNFLDLQIVRDQFFAAPGPSALGCN